MVQLNQLRHGRKTSISAGTCNNVDATLIIIGIAGQLTVGQIYAQLAQWRGCQLDSRGQCLKFEYLFSGEYRYISWSFTNCEPMLLNPGYAFGTNTKAYWYRVKRGLYALNTQGLARLANVLKS